MVALLFQRCVEISWLCMELELSMAIVGSEIESVIMESRGLILDKVAI